MTYYRQTLQRRYRRLRRLLYYGQDGHGNELNAQALLMVNLCLGATRRELQEAGEVLP